MLKDLLKFSLTAAEKKFIVEEFKKAFKATELRKLQFTKLVETKYKRTYNGERAVASVGKLAQGLGDKFSSLFSNSPDKIHNGTSVCLRNFKVVIQSANYLTQSEIDNLAHYMNKDEDGFIDITDFFHVTSNQYHPKKGM